MSHCSFLLQACKCAKLPAGPTNLFYKQIHCRKIRYKHSNLYMFCVFDVIGWSRKVGVTKPGGLNTCTWHVKEEQMWRSEINSWPSFSFCLKSTKCELSRALRCFNSPPALFCSRRGNGSPTFNESCDWPTSAGTRLFHISTIIRMSYYRSQFITDDNNRPKSALKYSGVLKNKGTKHVPSF